jgi:hypothetical protein
MHKIQVDLTTRQLRLLNNGNLVGIYPVAIGKPSTPTPVGQFQILNKAVNPGGPFGTRWMGFTNQGHGIHGNNNPSSIGQAVSNGCVRMYNRDVESIFPLINVGTPVEIFWGAFSPLPQPPEKENHLSYTVKSGDNLWSIAQRYGISVQEIAALNGITNVDLIYPGQVFKIPVK